MLPHKTKPGIWFAAELHQVSFKDVKVLEPSGQAERRGGALGRLEHAIVFRTMKTAGGWLSNYLRLGR